MKYIGEAVSNALIQTELFFTDRDFKPNLTGIFHFLDNNTEKEVLTSLLFFLSNNIELIEEAFINNNKFLKEIENNNTSTIKQLFLLELSQTYFKDPKKLIQEFKY